MAWALVSIGPILNMEVSPENRFSFNDRWRILIAPGVKSIGIAGSLCVPVTLGIENAERTKR
jgi:hypothetical protein